MTTKGDILGLISQNESSTVEQINGTANRGLTLILV